MMIGKIRKNRTGQCRAYAKKPFLTCIGLPASKPGAPAARLCTKIANFEPMFRVKKHHARAIRRKASGWHRMAKASCNARKEVVCEGSRCSVKKKVVCVKVCKVKDLRKTQAPTEAPILVLDPKHCTPCPEPRKGFETIDRFCGDVAMAL